jgi:hypothetical protein
LKKIPSGNLLLSACRSKNKLSWILNKH